MESVRKLRHDKSWNITSILIWPRFIMTTYQESRTQAVQRKNEIRSRIRLSPASLTQWLHVTTLDYWQWPEFFSSYPAPL